MSDTLKDRNDTRMKQMLALGLKFDGEVFVFNEPGLYINFHHLDITGFEDERWNTEYQKAGDSLNRHRAPQRIQEAIDLAVKYGGIDGDHHKAWVIDQMVRTLAVDQYDKVVADACAGEDGPDTFDWNVGTPP